MNLLIMQSLNYKKKNLSQDELGEYVSNLIHKCLNEEDGYSIQKDFKEKKKQVLTINN